jgi:putative ABC transport system permease protein
LSDFYTKTVALFSRQLGVLDLIVVVIVLLTISNCMTIAVVERTGEIGTALALGATREAMLRRFLVEGLVLGLVGAAIGVLVGLAAARGISAVGIPMPAPPGMSRGYTGAILITPGLVFKALVLALVSALVGAILPANRASKMEIVDAIRQGK